MKRPIYIRRISGASMLPTYQPGRIVFGITPYRRLKKGDVVIFQHDGLEKIKRIALTDGTNVTVAGDNLQASTDSRSFGPIDPSSIIGIVIWPKR